MQHLLSCIQLNGKGHTEGGFQKASMVGSVEAPKPYSGTFSGRFGSDSGGPPGYNSDSRPVSPTCGL